MTLQALARRLDELLDEHPDLEALTKQVGLTDKTALDHYRAARRAPRPATLVRLAEALHVSTDYLLGRTTEREKTAPVVEVEGREYRALGLALRAGAGGPIINYDEADALRLAFRADWLRLSVGSDEITEKQAFLVEVDGDSMEPGICDGAVVLARRWYMPNKREEVEAELKERGVYVLKKDVTAGESGLVVKRLALDAETLMILSDNPRYAPKLIPLRRDEHLEPIDLRHIIMGRVIWVGQEIGAIDVSDEGHSAVTHSVTHRVVKRGTGRPRNVRRQPDVGDLPRYDEDEEEEAV